MVVQCLGSVDEGSRVRVVEDVIDVLVGDVVGLANMVKCVAWERNSCSF